MSDLGSQPPPGPGPDPFAQPAQPAGPARMSAVSRFFNVFFSPSAVFEDVRRDPRGWLVPILASAAAVAVFTLLYFTRYDIVTVYTEYMRDNWGIKLAGMIGGPDAQAKALEAAMQGIKATPMWQFQASAIVNVLVGFVLIVWFFTFLYGLIAVLMGWLPPDIKASRLFINLGIVAAIAVVFIAITAGLKIASAVAAKGSGDAAAAGASPDWVAAVTIVVTFAALGFVVWSMMRLAKEPSFGRIMGAVSYGLAPTALFGLLGILILALRTPDATWIEDIVPADLTHLLNLKNVSGVLASLGTSLGFFNIWSLVLTIIGLSKALGRRTGEAAVAVLVPWGAWVLLKLVFAAIF